MFCNVSRCYQILLLLLSSITSAEQFRENKHRVSGCERVMKIIVNTKFRELVHPKVHIVLFVKFRNPTESIVDSIFTKKKKKSHTVAKTFDNIIDVTIFQVFYSGT